MQDSTKASSLFDIFEPAGPSLPPSSESPPKNSPTKTCLAVGAALTFCSTAVWYELLNASALTDKADKYLSLHVQQWLGAPLYFVNDRWYHTWQAGVKQSTALLLLALNQLVAPVTVRISGDATVTGQIRGGKRLLFDFPDRMVLLANHQVIPKCAA